jgi:hypothetical protein
LVGISPLDFRDFFVREIKLGSANIFFDLLAAA